MPQFIPGRELSHLFSNETVRSILDVHFSDLPHAAALIGTGSDVFGFDTPMSTDHSWGPSVSLFLRDEDAHLADDICEVMCHNLPHTFAGYPVHSVPVPDEPGVSIMQATTQGSVNHRVYPITLRAFCWQHLAYDIDQPLTAADWLTFPSQQLREITAGVVHYDGIGALTKLRERLTWYPHDVWLYLLAADWQRIGQEEHLMPRAGYVGDELGSAIIGSRLIRDIMNLCFLMEKQYAPYPKWFGTAFNQLTCARELTPLLWQAQCADTWQKREAAQCDAYTYIAHMHNALGLTQPMAEATSSFHNRPFQIIHGEVFAKALLAQITDQEVQHIASRRLIGSIDQFSDSTDIRSSVSWRPSLRQLYG